MNLFYVFDEYTDVEDEKTTRNMAEIFMDGLRNPDKPRPRGECVIGEVASQFVSSFGHFFLFFHCCDTDIGGLL